MYSSLTIKELEIDSDSEVTPHLAMLAILLLFIATMPPAGSTAEHVLR